MTSTKHLLRIAALTLLTGGLTAYAAKNRDYFAGVKRGEFSNAWVDDLLAESGCVITP